jgi:hypothetical protein
MIRFSAGMRSGGCWSRSRLAERSARRMSSARDRPRAPHAAGDTGRPRNLTRQVNLLINEKKCLIFLSRMSYLLTYSGNAVGNRSERTFRSVRREGREAHSSTPHGRQPLASNRPQRVMPRRWKSKAVRRPWCHLIARQA